ncbi:ABC-type transport auxiliary lipoprotein family protein [Aeromonas aquatica]|uniref:ABC-type transport auxiliary lipoprotein family protein n=1 Tax=Aeromonas aquatica TaxID=558964 RepID=UPI000690F311|nr:ABC-type transport auxiliary lipoprotein family protein [Aeromonas aquatica]
MIRQVQFPLSRLAVAALLLALLGACSMLGGTEEPPPAFYSLSGVGPVPPVTASPAVRSNRAPTLVVNPPRAAPGFDSQHIIYVREPYRLAYFAHSEWIDTPARMIAPRIVAALEGTGAFHAVVLAPSVAASSLRLDVDIIRLQHEFDHSPSRARFTLRAYLVDSDSRQVLAWREFDEAVVAVEDNPYGGVMAANSAVQQVLQRLANFCADAAGNWQLAAGARDEPADRRGTKARQE